jgi:hypothetical protein
MRPPATPLPSMDAWKHSIPWTLLQRERHALSQKYYVPQLREVQAARDKRAQAGVPAPTCQEFERIHSLYALLLPHIMSYTTSLVRLLYNISMMASPTSLATGAGQGLRQSCIMGMRSTERELTAYLLTTVFASLLDLATLYHYNARCLVEMCYTKGNLLILILKMISSTFPPLGPVGSAVEGDVLPRPVHSDLHMHTVHVLLELLYTLIRDSPSHIHILVSWKATGLLKRCLGEETLRQPVHQLFKAIMPYIPGARKYRATNMALVWGIWRWCEESVELEEGWLCGEAPDAATADAQRKREREAMLAWLQQLHGVQLDGETLMPVAEAQAQAEAQDGVLSDHFHATWRAWLVDEGLWGDEDVERPVFPSHFLGEREDASSWAASRVPGMPDAS